MSKAAQQYTALVKEYKDNEKTIATLTQRNKTIGEVIRTVDALMKVEPSI